MLALAMFTLFLIRLGYPKEDGKLGSGVPTDRERRAGT